MSMTTKLAEVSAIHNELKRRFANTKKAAAQAKEEVKKAKASAESQTKKASALVETRVPLIVDNLISKGIIDGESKQAACETLKDPAKCLQFLDNVVGYIRPGALGVSFGNEKKAASGNAINFATEDERESGRVFKEILFRNRRI